MAVVYHVTWTRLVSKIQREGLRTLQAHNWDRSSTGKPYGGGAVFAFESEWDAIRWASKMEWDHSSVIGSGTISILTIDHDGQWDPDFADTLTQMNYEAQWLKIFYPIPAKDIVAVKLLTPGLVQALMKRTEERMKCQK
jgi:hypothetical protein